MDYQRFHQNFHSAKLTKCTNDDEKENKIKLSALFRFATNSQKYQFFLGGFCAFAQSVLQLSALVLDGWIISSFLHKTHTNEQAATDDSLAFLIFLAFNFCFCFLFSCLKDILLKSSWHKIFRSLNKSYFNSLYHRPSPDERQADECEAEFENISKGIENVHKIVGNLVQSISIIFLSFIFCFFVRWQLSLIFSLFGIWTLFITFKIENKMTSKNLMKLSEMSQNVNVFDSCCKNIKNISLLNSGDYLIDKYKKYLDNVNDVILKIVRMYGIFDGVRMFLLHLLCGICMVYGFWLYSTDDMSNQLGDIFIVVSICLLNKYHFETIWMLVKDIQKIQISLKLYYNIIDQFDDKMEHEGLSMDFKKGNIIFDNVYYTHHDVSVLKGLTLEIKKGEMIGLVGDNDSGKNALFDLLTNNHNYNMGKIVIDGKRIENIKKESIRKSIAVVVGNEELFDGTIMENIRMAREGITDENVKKCVEVVGLHDVIYKLQNNFQYYWKKENNNIFSKQQKQLLAIARSIVTNPKIIFLDEATSVLTAEAEKRILISLREHLADSIIVISTQRSYCLEKVDKILVLDDGVVAEKGNHHQLISKQGKYWEFVKKWEKKKTSDSPEVATFSDKSLDESGFGQNDPNRFLCNSKGIVKLFVGSSILCFMRSLEKPLFIFFSYYLLITFFESSGSNWVVGFFFIATSFVCFSLSAQNILANTFAEHFLQNLKILTLRSFASEEESEQNGCQIRLSTFSMFPSKISELLDERFMNNLHLCFTIFLTSILSWIFVWQIALVSTVFTAISLIQIASNFILHYTERQEFTQFSMEKLQLFRRLRAKNYFLNEMEGTKDKKILLKILLESDLLIFHDFSCLAMGLLMIVSNPSDFTLIIIAFISSHASQRSLTILKMNVRAILKSLKAFLSILDAIKSPQEIVAKINKGIKLDISGDVQLKRLNFSYPSHPEKTVLNDLNLKIKCGEKIAICGKSKSGKSTIVNLLQKVYVPSKGNILFDNNNNIDEINCQHLRNQICAIDRNSIIFNGTVIENITMGFTDVPLQKVREVCKMSNAHHFIESLAEGYETIVGDEGLSLSIGQRQRIVLARALIRNPKILIVDEALACMETQSKETVEKGFWNASLGRTYIAMVNSLEGLENYDKICIIDEGNFVEIANSSQLAELKLKYANLVVTSKKIK